MGWGSLIAGGIGIERQLYQEGKLEWMNDWWVAIIEPGHFLSYYASKWTTPDSPTYKNETPQLTANPGTPIPDASGLCYLSGKIVRQNDFEEENFIKLIVDYGAGEWDEILAHFINDIDYDDLGPTINGDNEINEYLGTANQSGITNLFTEDACNYRNHVIVEYKLKKNEELTTITNITILARTKKYLEIGEDIGGTESFTRNPAQISWSRYLKKKGADYTNEMLPHVNDWTSLEAYCAASLCDTDPNYYEVNVPMPCQALVTATSNYRKWYPKYIVDPNIIVTGKANNASWWSSLNQDTEQRVNFDFGRKVVITRLSINNYHSEGSGTNAGIKNFVLQGSNTASDFDYVTYADGASGWADVDTGLQAAQHAASDEADWEDIDIDNVTGYRYYSLKIADNWGATLHMGIKNLRFYTGNAASSCTGDETNIRYAFDFNSDTIIPENDMEKMLWKSFNGRIIRSQGAYKPVWEGAEEADGAGGLQTRASKHTFTVGTNTVEKTLKWHRTDKKNLFRVNFRNSADRFKKCPDAEVKNEPDIALRGEDPYSEDCSWLIDACLATRRATLYYNKNWYVDYMSYFTGFPDSQQLEIYDRAALTAAIPGWSGKDFLINVKNEDDLGRSQFVVEAYLSGIYQDRGFEIQPGYPTRTIDPDRPLDAIDPDTVTVTNVTADAGNNYAVGSVRVQFTPPNSPTYCHTKIWVSTDDSTYYYAAQDSDGDAYLDGLGRLWDYGDTVYVKLENVTVTGSRSGLPDDADGSVAIDAKTKMAGFFAGQYDLWGGNASISHADTKIVIGGLDGTPKHALGTSADSLTIDNYATYPGFYADGDGKFRAGGSGQFFKWSGTNISWQGTNTSLTEAGLFTAANAVITGQITASTGAIGGWTIGATALTATGISLDSGNNRIRVYNGSNYIEIGGSGLIGYDSVLGTTVNVAIDGSAPEFSSGIIKEFEYQIYTSGVIKTAADPTATGGFLVNNTRIAAYDDTPTKLFEVIFNGSDKGDFYAGDYDNSNPGLKFDKSAGTMQYRGALIITSGSGYANISDKPTALADINSGEGTKLSGIAAGAQVNALYLACKINYISFSTANPGEIFFHGFDDNGDAANVDGSILINGIKTTLPRNYTNPNLGCTDCYIIYDPDQNISSTYYFLAKKIDGTWTYYHNSSSSTFSPTTEWVIGTAYQSAGELVDSATVWQSAEALNAVPNIGADVTSSNTAADTSAVNGVAASTISGWRYGATTYIDGGDIYTGTITAAKIAANTITASQINGAGFGTLTLSSGKIAINTTDALEIQSSGNILVKQGADIIMEGSGSGNPSMLRFADQTIAGQIRFEKSADANSYHRIQKTSTSDGLYIEPIGSLSGPGLFLGTSSNPYYTINLDAQTAHYIKSSGTTLFAISNVGMYGTVDFGGNGQDLGGTFGAWNNLELDGRIDHNDTMLMYSGYRSMTDDTYVTLFNIDLNTGECCSGFVITWSRCTDGTDFQSYSRNFNFAAVNKAGTVTVNSDEEVMQSSARSSDSLTVNGQLVASGTSVNFQVKVGTGLSGSLTLSTHWTLFLYTDNDTITIY